MAAVVDAAASDAAAAAAAAPPAAAAADAPIEVHIVPMLEDNYSYLIVGEGCCLAVDPCEHEKALEAAAALGVRITHVLCTHHHWDHSGGNAPLLKVLPDLVVVGGRIDNVEACSRPVDDDDEFTAGDLTVKCLLTPGHTAGHMR